LLQGGIILITLSELENTHLAALKECWFRKIINFHVRKSCKETTHHDDAFNEILV